MHRRLGQHDLQRGPDMPFDEVPTMGRCIGFPDHNMRMHLRFTLIERDITDQR
jgi:hypothetical protein